MLYAGGNQMHTFVVFDGFVVGRDVGTVFLIARHYNLVHDHKKSHALNYRRVVYMYGFIQ